MVAQVGPGDAANLRTKEIKWLPVDDLYLDPHNPRLALEKNASQDEIIREIYRNEGLEELASSFVKNGYFSEEPVVVVPRESGGYVVIEGNRRVATLKILLNPKLQRELRATHWPQPTPERLESLSSIPTVAYNSRDEVIPYLGFRHITGNKRWEPFAKAKYVAQLLEQGHSISDIEESIGDAESTVKRSYQSYVVYRQLQEDLGMDTTPIRERFSLLEVLLSQSKIRNFIKAPRRLPTEAVEHIVPDDGLENLREVISYVYGDTQRGLEPVLSDSRDIASKLAPVIANEESLAELRSTRDLESAYEFSNGELEYVKRKLRTARNAAQHALGKLPTVSEDLEVRTLIDQLARTVRELEKMING